MSVRDAISGFYAVLDRDDEALARALVREARVLQVRIKPHDRPDDLPHTRPPDAADLVRIARMARRICDDAGAALIINDRLDVALAADADGVHLGQTDLPIAEARRLAPRSVDRRSRPMTSMQVGAACQAGADYLGFGPVFADHDQAASGSGPGRRGSARGGRRGRGPAGGRDRRDHGLPRRRDLSHGRARDLRDRRREQRARSAGRGAAVRTAIVWMIEPRRPAACAALQRCDQVRPRSPGRFDTAGQFATWRTSRVAAGSELYHHARTGRGT